MTFFVPDEEGPLLTTNQDLEAFAQDLEEEEENCQDVYASSFYKASQSKSVIERRYSAQVVKPSEEVNSNLLPL